MSRHPRDERYDEREADYYRRPRRDREYDDLEVDITRSRHPEQRRPDVMVRERDSVVSERRGPRQPDFLRDDYGKSTSAGALVVRDEEREETFSRAPGRSRAPTERVEKDKFVFEERERSDRGPPYPRDRGSELGVRGRDDTEERVIYRERTRSRPPPREEVDTEEKVVFRERTRSRPPPRGREDREEIDINIRREESRGPPPAARSPPPVEEIRFRRGGAERLAPRGSVEKTEIDITREESRGPPPRPRSVIEREEIDIHEQRSSAPRAPRSEIDEKEIVFRESRREPASRGREVTKEEIDIDIRERSAAPARRRSMSRPNLVARKEEEWIVHRPRTPPPQDYEKEEIIIRRRERTPSPEPPREPTPEPSPPPPPLFEPIYRPPIIQEVITHHRHIDHGVERARSPTPPPPAPPSPPPAKETKEDNLEIEIRRKGVRNGKPFEEDITIERDKKETEETGRELQRYEERKRDVSVMSRRRSQSPRRRHYDDEMIGEADYYNRKIASRAYPGEAYNGATKDWGLVDIPPGTERVRMDGIGGGAQEVYWEHYNGQRRGRFISGDQVYEQEYGNGYRSPAPAAIPPPPVGYRDREERDEIKITHTRTNEDKPRRRDRMWTEVAKDLVIKEAIDEMGYEYEETDEHFYVIEYLKYEDVLRLVEISEDIKRERRERIREIQREREERDRAPKMLPPPPVPAPPRSKYDERIYEREYIYDRDGRRRR